MKFNKWIIGLAAVGTIALVSAARAQTIPIPAGLGQDVSNAQSTVAAVESATSGLSFTNTSLYFGTGLENQDGVAGAQYSYVDFAARVARFNSFDLALGAQAVFGATGATFQSADVRVFAQKDIDNFQLYGGPLFGRNVESADTGWYGGGALGVRYNLTAGTAGTSNPILQLIGGSSKVHTYLQTELDVDLPFNVTVGGLNVEREWKAGVGISF